MALLSAGGPPHPERGAGARVAHMGEGRASERPKTSPSRRHGREHVLSQMGAELIGNQVTFSIARSFSDSM